MLIGVRAAEGNDHPPLPLLTPPPLSSSKLTHREGEDGATQGWGETHLKEEEERPVLEKTSQTTDGKFLLSPEAWCH